jgi:dolichol-phosphate mannosyltransferase
MQQLSVVIPTFNERNNIEVLVPAVFAVFSEHGIDGEVVVVDDNSNDGTVDVLLTLARRHPEMKVLVRKGPASLARSWYEGFDAATKKNIVCIDADLCHDPRLFPLMLEKLSDCDIVIGSRYLADASSGDGKSFAAKMASVLGQHANRIVLGMTETDSSHSFRMFRRSVFEGIKGRLRKEGNVFLIEFLLQAKRQGARVCEVPIVYGERTYGETKLRIGKESLRYARFLLESLLTGQRARSPR